MTETKAEMARMLRQDPKRTVKEICPTLQISEATFYRHTTAHEENAHVHDTR